MVKLGAVADWMQSAEADAVSKAKGGGGKAVNAAKQFEALLIGQMLKTMREGGSGWLGTGEDQAAESAMGMAEEHFAAALSASGGFGLATTVQAGLTSAEQIKSPPKPIQKLQD